MRTTLFPLLRALTRTVDFPGPVYEFGAYRVSGQAHMPLVRDFFPGRKYVGCDMRMGPGVDEVQDLHALALPDASVGTAILFDTIEHVSDPMRALQEVDRILVPGGIVLMTSVFYFPVHAYPDDYWRFTASAFASLLRPFPGVVTVQCGLAVLPHTVVGIGLKGPVDAGVESRIRKEVESWKKSGSRSWKETVMDLCPPILVSPAYSMFEKLRNKQGSRD
jgi:SAM-dependent methyltransferase